MLTYWETLIATRSNIAVNDSYAQLWGRKLSNAYTVATYSGTLPATLTGTKVGYLESYKIYGNTVQDGTPTPENPIVPSGCGVRTENLFDKDNYNLIRANAGTGQGQLYGDPRTAPYAIYIPVTGGETYSFYSQAALSSSCFTINTPAIGVSITLNGANTFGTTNVRPAPASANYLVLFLETASATQDKLDSDLATLTIVKSSTAPTSYIPYGYKLPLTVNGVEYPIYLDDAQLAKDEYVDSTTGKIYRRTENLSPPEEEWIDEWIWGDGTIHPSTEIKTSPFIDVSTCETCIMEVFSTENEWAAAGYREMAFYDENKQYLGWIGGGGRQTLRPNSSENWSEFPAGTVYVRIGCNHGDQPFYPQLVSGYTPVHRFYSYYVPTDPPAPFPQIPTSAGSTTISWAGEGLAPSEVEFVYKVKR